MITANHPIVAAFTGGPLDHVEATHFSGDTWTEGWFRVDIGRRLGEQEWHGAYLRIPGTPDWVWSGDGLDGR